MRQRGYAVAFLIVLVATCAGAFLGGSFLWRRVTGDFQARNEWSPPETRVAEEVIGEVDTQIGVGSAESTPRPTATSLMIPTPRGASLDLPAATPTLALTGTSPTETGTVTPTQTLTPTATLPAPGDFPYGLARPVRHSTGDCPGNYVLGQVTDQAGNPLPDVTLWLVDEYGNQETKVSKAAGSEAGYYDFPIFGPNRRFYLSIVDSSGHPVSPQVEIPHGVGANADASCHWVDWRRQ